MASSTLNWINQSTKESSPFGQYKYYNKNLIGSSTSKPFNSHFNPIIPRTKCNQEFMSQSKNFKKSIKLNLEK